MASQMSKSISTKSDSGLSASFLAGSEEIFDFICQPCSTESIYLEAVGYCENCDEYLCDTCFKCHRKTAAAKHHTLLEKADMPTNKVAASPRDDLKQTCPKHKTKLLEYFCNSHTELCCVICLKADHGSCKLTSHVPVVSDGIVSSDEYKILMTDLKALLSSETKQQHIINLCTKDNDKFLNQSLAGIRDFRQAVDALMDKYEEDSVMKVSEIHHANSEKIKAATSENQGVISDVTVMIANLDAKAKGGKQNQLFVDVKLSKQRLSVMEAEARDATDCKITRYGFHQAEKINEVMSAISAAWSLSIREDGDEIKARYLGEVNVKSAGDTYACSITGIAVLPGGDIVVTDGTNNSLKLINTTLNKVSSRIPLSSIPLDVTNTYPNEVVVSLGEEGKIEIYTVTDVLSLSNTMHIDEMGFCGLSYTEDKFILTYPYDQKGLIKIVDMFGRVLSTIFTDKIGNRLFTMPRYIAVGRYGDVVYVTEWKTDTVTTMTPDGSVISVYRSDKLRGPLGVTVGPDHNVYVCSENTHSVLQLTATGEFQQVLLDKQLSWYPAFIAYDDTSDRLYISSTSGKPEKCNYVKFFQME